MGWGFALGLGLATWARGVADPGSRAAWDGASPWAWVWRATAGMPSGFAEGCGWGYGYGCGWNAASERSPRAGPIASRGEGAARSPPASA
eukprot:CAMPEP_0118853462 /NCGR_PEP_ID=MMETSP1163-20130328/2039_1 /TAXON_ID=124430 /ORGANISM="Phaeomonas parva, Strain CCMP2877" /LENGTH=89 /DNA_ID=CAMNT_0006786013 /DNA_START=21 /DNA_END=286 /DNA_ORIENTATION=-